MKFAVCSCSKSGPEEFPKSPLGRSLEKLKGPCPYTEMFFFNNTFGLSHCYNLALRECREKGIPYLVCIHDDVFLLDVFWQEKLLDAFNDYQAVGLAGTSKLRIYPGAKIAWHTCSEQKDWKGAVQHPIQNKTEKPTIWTNFGIAPAECTAIDGLFIAIDVTKLGEKNVEFDPQFKFDFYDLDFSIACSKAGLKIGVSNIATMHMSHGAGLNGESYAKAQTDFITKWKGQK